jgi:cytochrome bd-type quinol oxidase subunit 1
LLLTSESISTGVPTASVVFSLVTTTLLYIVVLVFVIKFVFIQIKNPITKTKYYYFDEENND